MLAQNVKNKLLFSFVLSVFLVFSFTVYHDAVCSDAIKTAIKKLPLHIQAFKLWFSIALSFCAIFLYSLDYRKSNELVFKYRFVIALAIFVLCVIFEITGSSIGMWCRYFGEKDRDILL